MVRPSPTPGSPQDLPPLRVERALWIMPDLEALAPLRAAIVSLSQPQASGQWSAAGQYATVGKRNIWPLDVRQRRREVLEQVTRHVSTLYEAVLSALEGEQRGDFVAAVTALLGAGEVEERAGRLTQARAWCDQALALSKDFQDRRLEFEVLHRLGHLAAVRGDFTEAARYYQRGLALAEASRYDRGTIRACQGLGRLGSGLGQRGRGETWFLRALELAERTSDRLHEGRLRRDLGDLARRQGDGAKAAELLQRAREIFGELQAHEDLAFALQSQGLLDAQLGKHEEALAHYRGALSRLRQAEQNLWLEISIRINLAEVFAAGDRYKEAFDQLREAEDIAVIHTFARGLAQVYTAMGRLCRHQVDEHGFVFFEKALELCREVGGVPAAEADVHFEYGIFRSRLGERDAARAHLERARMLHESNGDEAALEGVRAELDRLRA